MNDKKVCVIIPVYNNVKTIGSVIDESKTYLSDIIVIDDGSNDGTSEVIKSKDVLSHKFEHNQGKGAAIKKGLKIAEEKGFDYAITIDADGQHFPKDITKFIAYLSGNNNILAIGAREFKENVTGRSKFGRVWSNFWCNFLTLEKIEDAQSGFRMYPVKLVNSLKLRRKRYDFEVEVLVKAIWKGAKVVHIPISVHYDDPKDRISHFRGFYDNTRITFLFFKMIFIGIFKLPILLIRKNRSKPNK